MSDGCQLSEVVFQDLSLGDGRDAPVELALHPSKSKVGRFGCSDDRAAFHFQSSADDSVESVKLGEVLFLATYSRDRLTVIVSKIRNLSSAYESQFLLSADIAARHRTD